MWKRACIVWWSHKDSKACRKQSQGYISEGYISEACTSQKHVPTMSHPNLACRAYMREPKLTCRVYASLCRKQRLSLPQAEPLLAAKRDSLCRKQMFASFSAKRGWCASLLWHSLADMHARSHACTLMDKAQVQGRRLAQGERGAAREGGSCSPQEVPHTFPPREIATGMRCDGKLTSFDACLDMRNQDA